MFRFKTTLVFLIISVSLFAQDSIDSLKTVLNKAEEKDKIEVFLRLSEQFSTINADSTIFYGKKALTLAQEKENELGQGKAYIAIGAGYQSKRDIKNAQATLEKALKIGEKYNELEMLSYAYNNIGNNYFFLKDMDKAMQMYIKSQEIDEQLNDTKGLTRSHANLGMIYSGLQQYDRAEKSYKKGLKYAMESKAIGAEVQIKVGLLNMYSRSKSLDSAVLYGREALALSKKHKMNIGIVKASASLASPLIRKGFYQEGLDAAILAESFFIKQKNQNQVNFMQLEQAFAYEGLKKYNKAIEIVMELRARKFPFLNELERLMFKIEKGRGNYKAALVHHEKYKAELDSVRSKNNIDKLAELEKKYETEKKQRSIERLEQQAAFQALAIKQKNTVILVVVVVVLLFGIAIYLVYQQKRLKHQRSISDMEQKFLRFQMNPHFIFNSLTSIQNFMLKNDAKQAGIYMAKFARLMRQILENSREEFISLEEEIKTLENYMDLQKLRLNNNFNYEINICDDLDPEEVNIPPMFAQPFIENSLEHGINHLEDKGVIKVNFRKDGKLVKIEVEDNGIGLNASKEKDTRINHHSLATKITQERIALFNRDLTEKIKLMIDNAISDSGEVSGTKVNVMVPYRYA